MQTRCEPRKKKQSKVTGQDRKRERGVFFFFFFFFFGGGGGGGGREIVERDDLVSRVLNP